jgi:hypothetical protein
MGFDSIPVHLVRIGDEFLHKFRRESDDGIGLIHNPAEISKLFEHGIAFDLHADLGDNPQHIPVDRLDLSGAESADHILIKLKF